MKLSKEARTMTKIIVIIVLVAGLISLLYYRSKEALPFIWGLLVGGLASLLRLFILEKTVNSFISGSTTKASRAQVSHLARLLIAFVALLIGAIVDGISLWGAVIGIFSYQVGTYVVRFQIATEVKNRSQDEENKKEI